MESRLFQPITLGNLTVNHRLWVSPMCQYSAVDGVPQDWHMAHLGSFAIGRAGLIVTEATAVNPVGRISPRDTGIWNQEQVDAWARVTAFSHSQGVPMAIQLAHAGRKASATSPYEGRGPVAPQDGGWEAVAPSSIAFGRLPVPHELDESEIEAIISDFVESAKRSVAAGFDAVEIHAAHGYLIHEFLSPISNERTDKWGGDFVGRTRFLLDITRGIRQALPAGYPLFVRISATDWIPGGWSSPDSVALAMALSQEGTDLIDVSTAGIDHRQEVVVGPGYQVPYARDIKKEVDIPVAAVGLITTPPQAEALVLDGSADVIMIGRQFLREPTFALRAAAELGGVLEWAPQYGMAKYSGSIP